MSKASREWKTFNKEVNRQITRYGRLKVKSKSGLKDYMQMRRYINRENKLTKKHNADLEAQWRNI